MVNNMKYFLMKISVIMLCCLALGLTTACSQAKLKALVNEQSVPIQEDSLVLSYVYGRLVWMEDSLVGCVINKNAIAIYNYYTGACVQKFENIDLPYRKFLKEYIYPFYPDRKHMKDSTYLSMLHKRAVIANFHYDRVQQSYWMAGAIYAPHQINYEGARARMNELQQFVLCTNRDFSMKQVHFLAFRDTIKMPTYFSASIENAFYRHNDHFYIGNLISLKSAGKNEGLLLKYKAEKNQLNFQKATTIPFPSQQMPDVTVPIVQSSFWSTPNDLYYCDSKFIHNVHTGEKSELLVEEVNDYVYTFAYEPMDTTQLHYLTFHNNKNKGNSLSYHYKDEANQKAYSQHLPPTEGDAMITGVFTPDCKQLIVMERGEENYFFKVYDIAKP